MATAISICSNALLMLGDDPIASFSENTKRARLCANLWPDCRDMIIRLGAWPVARKQVTLAAEVAEPAFDWGYAFPLPSDWRKTLQVGGKRQRVDFEQIGRKLYSDAATLPLVYVAKLDDPTQWDALMVDTATLEMCARLAYPITQSSTLMQEKRQEADRALRVARSVAGQDNPPEDWSDSPFVDVRG